VSVVSDKRPVRITSAHASHSDEIRARETRYLLSMGVRTVCVVLAVVTRGTEWMWVFGIGAVVLPYVAVVMANAGARPEPAGPAPFHDESRRQLPPGQDEEPG
jgi:hypothetical protein